MKQEKWSNPKGKKQMIEKTKYVVTAIDSSRYHLRYDISIPFKNRKRAENLIKGIKKDYKTALPKYQILSNFKIERRK